MSCAIRQASNNRNPSQQAGPRPLDPCLPAILRALIHASHQVRCWACPDATWCSISSLVGPHPTATTWVAEPQSLRHQCLHPHFSFFNRHHLSRRSRFVTILQLCPWRLRRRAAVRFPSDLLPTEGAEGLQTVVFHASNTTFDRFVCVYVLLDFGVSDVSANLNIQTYRTGFIDNLMLNELLKLSRRCAVARDDVAAIRIHVVHSIVGLHWKSMSELHVHLQSQSPPVLVSQPI